MTISNQLKEAVERSHFCQQAAKQNRIATDMGPGNTTVVYTEDLRVILSALEQASISKAVRSINEMDKVGEGLNPNGSECTRTVALEIFTDYFVRNYPGPRTIIGDPNWHAPMIFRAAEYALAAAASGGDAKQAPGDSPAERPVGQRPNTVRQQREGKR